MPRIRSLKPEHKQHRKIGPLTDRQYRLWVGMLTEADDEGRLVADPAQLRLQVFGYHPRVRLEHVTAALQTLHEAHLIELYTVDGIQYAAFPSWRDHQYIQKRMTSKLPPPLHSGSSTVPVQEPPDTAIVGSRIKDQGEDQGSEGIKERSGGDRGGEENQGGAVAPVPETPGQRHHREILALFDKPAQPTREQQLEALARSNGTTADDLLRTGHASKQQTKRR